MSAASPDYAIVIPARYASARLPAKLLAEVGGKCLLQWTWERARSSAAREVVIATDDDRIVTAARSFDARVVMTSAEHRSGSDRIAECVSRLGWTDGRIVVNLQGDEPLMPPQCLDQVALLLQDSATADVASLFTTIDSAKVVGDPNAVKVVTGQDGTALLFSRSPIPNARDYPTIEKAMAAGIQWRRHLGIYAYRKSALDWFAAIGATPLEEAERLEQLRFLEYGRKIVLAESAAPIPQGVDTAEDLERVRDLVTGKGEV